MKRSKTIVWGDAEITVLPRTIRTDITLRSIIIRVGAVMETIADTHNVTISDIDMVAYEYAMLCSRIQPNGDLPFAVATARDDDATVIEAFESYLETDAIGLVDNIRATMREIDAPVNEATGPVAPMDAKKKPSATSGKNKSVSG